MCKYSEHYGERCAHVLKNVYANKENATEARNEHELAYTSGVYKLRQKHYAEIEEVTLE